MREKTNERVFTTEHNLEKGKGKITFDMMYPKGHMPEAVQMYCKATLEPGAMVGFHKHIGESESYYILSGSGEYHDDNVVYDITAGDSTFTPNGHGHSIRNTGSVPLEFMVLIVAE